MAGEFEEKESRMWLAALKILLFTLGWYIPSIGLTFYNHWLFRTHGFNFPLLVTSLHFLMNFFNSFFVRTLLTRCTGKPRVFVPWRTYFRMIVPTAAAGALDIGLTNSSLLFITVTLITMIKSSTIVFMVLFAFAFRLEKFTWTLCLIILSISGGVSMTTYSKTEFNLIGVLMCFSAAILAALRWILTQILMQDKEFKLRNPVDMLFHVSPVMFLTLVPCALLLEGEKLYHSPLFIFAAPSTMVWAGSIFLVFAGAYIAFVMINAEFLLVSETSSVTMSVLGICKEIVTILISIIFVGDRVSTLNTVGLVVSIVGLCMYNIYKFRNAWEQMEQEKDIELGYFEVGHDEDFDDFESGGELSLSLSGDYDYQGDGDDMNTGERGGLGQRDSYGHGGRGGRASLPGNRGGRTRDVYTDFDGGTRDFGSSFGSNLSDEVFYDGQVELRFSDDHHHFEATENQRAVGGTEQERHGHDADRRREESASDVNLIAIEDDTLISKEQGTGTGRQRSTSAGRISNQNAQLTSVHNRGDNNLNFADNEYGGGGSSNNSSDFL
eukprot:Nk52_evm72s212 gene=Nk52_evmTU72s212